MSLAEKKTMWKKMLLKKAALLLVAMAVALTWPRGGRTQGACVIERGQDPLDVLNTGIRHNVWIILDTSGSMNRRMDGTAIKGGGGSPEDDPQAKLFIAKDVLKQIINEMVDAAGQPLVNWGLASFGTNDDPCFGGVCNGMIQNVQVPSCGGPDPRPAIFKELDLKKSGGLAASGFTPNGKALQQLGDFVDLNVSPNLLPNQKNFFILVTDGDDTCESPTATDDGNLLPTLLNCSGTPTPFTVGAFCDLTAPAMNTRTYNAGLKGRNTFLGADQLPLTKDDIDTFVIGVGLTGPVAGDPLGQTGRTCHLSWEASGKFFNAPFARPAFFASSPQALKDALKNSLAQVGTPASEVTLGAPVVGSIKERIPEANSSISAADVLTDVNDADDVRESRLIRGQHKNNMLLTTSVETPGFKGHLKAFNVFKVIDPGLASEKRVADFTLLWDAGVELQKRHPDDRTIIFNRKGDPPNSPTLTFRTGTVTVTDLFGAVGAGVGYLKEIDGVGAKTDADAVKIVVNVIRGFRLSKDPLTGTIYKSDGVTLNFSDKEANGANTWKLLDSSAAGPTVVLNPPRSPDFDSPLFHGPEYGTSFPTGFFWDRINRLTQVFLGTNGGLMHAFRGDNGAELYAYIPDDLLGPVPGEITGNSSKLKDLVALLVAQNNGIHNHRFFIASSATVEDAFLTTDGKWHTLLAFGRGRGGKFLTVLDVSDVGDWNGGITDTTRIPDGDPRLPRLRFNRGNREGINDGADYDTMGETWSIPVMGNVKTATSDQWVLFAGSGYGCKGTAEGKSFYVLKLEDGSVYQRFTLPADVVGAVITQNALVATPALYNPHEEGVKDNQDFVTRIFISDLQGRVFKGDVSDPNPTKWTFLTFFSMGPAEPITVQAAILKMIGVQQILVFVGSGGDRRVVKVPPDSFRIAGIVDGNPEGTNTPGTVIKSPTGTDFLFTLPPEERVFVAPVTATTADGKGAVFFASSKVVLNTATCTSQFESTLFAFQASSGLGVFDLDPYTGGTQSQVGLGEGKVTGLFHRDEHLYVSKSGGIGLAGETEVRGSEEFPNPATAAGMVQILIDSFRLSPF